MRLRQHEQATLQPNTLTPPSNSPAHLPFPMRQKPWAANSLKNFNQEVYPPAPCFLLWPVFGLVARLYSPLFFDCRCGAIFCVSTFLSVPFRSALVRRSNIFGMPQVHRRNILPPSTAYFVRKSLSTTYDCMIFGKHIHVFFAAGFRTFQGDISRPTCETTLIFAYCGG
jgi:hypothetical protein